MSDGKNGNVKWYQLTTALIAILGIIVTIAIWGINCVSANDRLRENGDNELKSIIVGYIIPIGKDVAAIKMKLDIP